MNAEFAVDILRLIIQEALLLITPILGTAIVVGVVVSLVQSITSIQEQTLTFAPKLVIVGLVILFSAPWIIRSLIEFTIMFFEKIPQMAL